MSGELRDVKPIARRDFLGKAAATTCGAALGLAGVGILRLPFPGVLPQEATQVKLGPPEDVVEGSPVWVKSAKAFVFREGGELFAISAVCTHLGCIVRAEKDGFACPCHGTIFGADGRVEKGPAPSPLPWLALSIEAGGVLVLDTNKQVETGTRLKA